MHLIPFGEVEDERYLISKKYGLIETVGQIWRLTQKCKDNYEEESYYYYLKGKVEKPTRKQAQKQQKDTIKTEDSLRSDVIEELLSL